MGHVSQKQTGSAVPPGVEWSHVRAVFKAHGNII